MCMKSHIHFTKCDHVVTSLTPCPSHNKEQESARGLFGCLFQRDIRRKKTCGRVLPHHLQSETYCEACSVRKGHFKTQRVGNGALKVRKQEVFLDENKEAARIALQKAQREGRPNHQVVHAETSVWLNDLYHHPETLAKKEVYARQAAKAPPVSSRHRTENRSRAADLSPRKRLPKGDTGESRQAESIKPAQPTPTHQYSSYCANEVSPAAGHSPHMPRDHRSFAARAQASGLPDPRRETVPKITKSRNDPPPMSARQAASKYADFWPTPYEYDEKEESNQGPRKYPDWERQPSEWETKKAEMANWIERNKARQRDSKTDDEDSDVSFVCQTSRTISDQQRARSARRRHRRLADSGRPRRRH